MMRMSCCIVQSLGVRRGVCFAVILLGTACWLKAAEAATPQTPIGWAVVNGKGVESTTGGGKVVTAHCQGVGGLRVKRRAADEPGSGHADREWE